MEDRGRLGGEAIEVCVLGALQQGDAWGCKREEEAGEGDHWHSSCWDN